MKSNTIAKRIKEDTDNTQGMFVGVASDNLDEHTEQKILHAEIVVNFEGEGVAAHSHHR